MSKSTPRVCPTCGAVVFSDHCDLCGTPIDAIEQEEPVENGSSAGSPEPVSSPKKSGGSRVVARKEERLVCPTCGAANRIDAKFCDQCGQGFAVAPETASSAPVRPPSKPKPSKPAPAPTTGSEVAKPRVGLYIIVAIVAVVGLYALSIMTGGPSSSEPAVTQRPGPDASSSSSNEDLDTYLPEDDALASSLSARRDSIDAATDPAVRQVLREEMVRAYAGAGRLDLAGREQEAIAKDLNTADAWAAAGNMHFDWMENQSGNERVKAAQRAARDYEKALEIDPDNLDVRTDLGVAYLNDPSSPMLAIQNTNKVLEADSNHVQANFNKGVMLAQIGRTEEAIKYFHKVVRLSKPGEPAHDRALEVLSQLGAPMSGNETAGTNGKSG